MRRTHTFIILVLLMSAIVAAEGDGLDEPVLPPTYIGPAPAPGDPPKVDVTQSVREAGATLPSSTPIAVPRLLIEARTGAPGEPTTEATRPPASTGLLSDADKAAIDAATDKSTIKAYMDNDGNVRVSTAKPTGSFLELPNDVTRDLLANPNSKTTLEQVTRGDEISYRYSLENVKTDSGLYVDYRLTTKTTYETSFDGEVRTKRTTNNYEKDDVTTRGFQSVRTERLFEDADANGNLLRRGMEIPLGSGADAKVAQVGSVYAGRDELLNEYRLEVQNTGTSDERKEHLRNEIQRLEKITDTNYREPRPNTIITLPDGTKGGEIRPDGEELRMPGVDGANLRETLINQLRAQGVANPETQADALIEGANNDRRARHGFQWSDIYATQPWYSIVSSVVSSYEQFGGIQRLSTLFMGDFVQKNRQMLAKEFCGFAGIESCLVSAICGEIHEITANNVLVGDDPIQRRINSAALNAERSESIVLAGLDTQRLIDIFGNSTSIGGRFVDFTDPDFDSQRLGNISLRLYHVQYSITNNVADEDLFYNLEFRRLSAPAVDPNPLPANVSATIEDYQGDITLYARAARSINTRGTVTSVNWFPQRQVLKTDKTDQQHKYKYSPNEYDVACLTFNPGVPSGGAFNSDIVKEFCVPFTEYRGGATDIGSGPEANFQTPDEKGPAQQEGGRI